MAYKRGPHPALLYLASQEGYMQTKYMDEVGNTASVGQCRKLLPTIHVRVCSPLFYSLPLLITCSSCYLAYR